MRFVPHHILLGCCTNDLGWIAVKQGLTTILSLMVGFHKRTQYGVYAGFINVAMLSFVASMQQRGIEGVGCQYQAGQGAIAKRQAPCKA